MVNVTHTRRRRRLAAELDAALKQLHRLKRSTVNHVAGFDTAYEISELIFTTADLIYASESAFSLPGISEEVKWDFVGHGNTVLSRRYGARAAGKEQFNTVSTMSQRCIKRC